MCGKQRSLKLPHIHNFDHFVTYSFLRMNIVRLRIARRFQSEVKKITACVQCNNLWFCLKRLQNANGHRGVFQNVKIKGVIEKFSRYFTYDQHATKLQSLFYLCPTKMQKVCAKVSSCLGHAVELDTRLGSS